MGANRGERRAQTHAETLSVKTIANTRQNSPNMVECIHHKRKLHKERLFCMNHYTKLAWQLKRAILNFSRRICKGIGKPEQKLVANMLYGIAESGSCHLSKISRALKEPITLKKTIERLSRGLRDFSAEEQDMLLDNYTELLQGKVDTWTVFVVDGSDVTKPHSEKMEGLQMVHDGSTGKVEKGYFTLEVAALTKESKTPLPVYDRVYSAAEESFTSEDDEVLKALRYVRKTFGGQGIRTMDRGYDNLTYYTYFLRNQEKFIIRATKNRNVCHKGETRNIMEVAKQYKGRYRIDFCDKKGKLISCKTTIVPVSLPKHPDAQLNLVVVYGFGKEPMLLLTNLRNDDPRLANTVTKVYLIRWRIEEYFRFKKQQYGFEGFRVRSLNAIRALHRLLSLLTGMIGLLSEKRDESLFVMELISISKRIYRPKKDKAKRKFLHYAIGDAVFAILRRTSVGIEQLLRPPPQSQQLSLFSTA